MIRIKTCESGDWVILEAVTTDGRIKGWSGHEISYYDWMEALNFLDIETTITELSDEEMESLC